MTMAMTTVMIMAAPPRGAEGEIPRASAVATTATTMHRRFPTVRTTAISMRV